VSGENTSDKEAEPRVLNDNQEQSEIFLKQILENFLNLTGELTVESEGI